MPTQPPKANSTSQGKRNFRKTDAGNAEFFAALHKDNLRYDYGHDRWLIWDEHWWIEDKGGQILQKAKRAARLRYSRATKISDEKARNHEIAWALQSESKAKLEAALALAKSEHPLCTTGQEWDSDPWILGVRNGVVDLRTGRLRRGKQGDLITLHSRVPFDPLARCPRWEQFLSEIFGGDKELIEFVQRAAGYSLAGDTSEQCFFPCFGTGANGKSTFLEVIRHVLGDYAYNLPFSAFELKARSAIPNDVAPLQGRRFVTSLETNESAALNEARIKLLTGGDPVSAHFLYREYFTFVPLAKYWLAFNHKPTVTDDSPGFWRRVRLIPFGEEFKGDRVDLKLVSKLKAEASGILAWLVQGCLAWQKGGLGLPRQVEEATQAYRRENDVVGEFLADCCLIHPAADEAAGALWQAFKEWSTDNGDCRPQVTRKAFTDRLKARGLKKARVGHDRTWTWLGLRLLSSGDREPPTGSKLRTDADVKLPLLNESKGVVDLRKQ